MENLNYRLDKNAFQTLTFQEADKQINDSAGLFMEERIKQFNYLMSVAYRFLGEKWPRMDKGYFEKIKRQ